MNIDILSIQQIASKSGLIFTDHAVKQMAKRRISDSEIVEVILSGAIIEQNPDDKYSPSCLIYGETSQGRPIHVLCSSPPRVRVITAYRPDPNEWIDNRYRRVS